MSRKRRRSILGDGTGANDPFSAEEDINPNAYIVNLADCMLVLAVGFMVALVAAWNVDLPSVSELNKEDMTELVDAEEIAEDMKGSGSSYSEVGTVYQDPKTGKRYILEDAEKNGGK